LKPVVYEDCEKVLYDKDRQQKENNKLPESHGGYVGWECGKTMLRWVR